MPEIAIQQIDKRFSRKVRALHAFSKRIISFVWEKYEPSEISLVLADDSFIQDLNLRYRGKDSPTNVLSFEDGHPPKDGDLWLAGDIIVSYDTVLKEARLSGKTFEAHYAHLLIHGALHLQGYDHIDEKDALQMEAKEVYFMKKLGYEDPYKDMDL